MIESRLLMLEGLPGSGKSTNSSFLRMQLELNGYRAKWIHEVARPHPLLFLSDICFTHDEYREFLAVHPQAADILNHVAQYYQNTVGMDLMEIEWNYLDAIGDKTYNALKNYDAWSADISKRKRYLLDKWILFAERANRDRDCVYILDSGIFQFHIWGYLLENAPYSEIESFIHSLIEIVKPLNPTLVYLFRENVEHSITILENDRGIQGFEGIWQRDHQSPYYLDKPEGAEGFKAFLRDYASTAERLYEGMDCTKVKIDKTEENWTQYEEQLLSFLQIRRTPYCDATLPSGDYRSDSIELSMRIDDLILKDPEGVVRRLTPKSQNVFYVENLPTILRLDDSKRLVVSAGQIAARWTTLGEIYHLVD